MKRRLYMLIPSPGSRIYQYVTAVGADGKSIFESGSPRTALQGACFDLPASVDVLDRLLTVGNELIVSNRASQALAKCTFDPAIVRHPIAVRPPLSHKDRIDGYELWSSECKHDLLHASAEIRKFKGHVLSVYEWVAAVKNIPEFDVFLGNTNRWFVSERFVDVVFENEFLGFGFACIPCR